MKKIFDKVTYYMTKRQRGATAVEYALIVALVALAIVVGLTALGGGINTAYNNIVSILQGAVGG